MNNLSDSPFGPTHPEFEQETIMNNSTMNENWWGGYKCIREQRRKEKIFKDVAKCLPSKNKGYSKHHLPKLRPHNSCKLRKHHRRRKLGFIIRREIRGRKESWGSFCRRFCFWFFGWFGFLCLYFFQKLSLHSLAQINVTLFCLFLQHGCNFHNIEWACYWGSLVRIQHFLKLWKTKTKKRLRRVDSKSTWFLVRSWLFWQVFVACLWCGDLSKEHSILIHWGSNSFWHAKRC